MTQTTLLKALSQQDQEIRRKVYEDIPQVAEYAGGKAKVTHYPAFFNKSWFEPGDEPGGMYRPEWVKYWESSGKQDRRGFPDILDRGKGFLGQGFRLERATGIEGYPRHWTLNNDSTNENQSGWRTWRMLPKTEFNKGRFGIEREAIVDSLVLMREIVRTDGGGAFILPPSMMRQVRDDIARRGESAVLGHNIRAMTGFQADILFRMRAQPNKPAFVEVKHRYVLILMDLFGQ